MAPSWDAYLVAATSSEAVGAPPEAPRAAAARGARGALRQPPGRSSSAGSAGRRCSEPRAHAQMSKLPARERCRLITERVVRAANRRRRTPSAERPGGGPNRRSSRRLSVAAFAQVGQLSAKRVRPTQPTRSAARARRERSVLISLFRVFRVRVCTVLGRSPL